MTMNDDVSARQLKEMVFELKRRVEFLERENNRRKAETTQLSSAFRRG